MVSYRLSTSHHLGKTYHNIQDRYSSTLNIVKVDLIIDLCILLTKHVFLSSVFTLPRTLLATLNFLWGIWMCRKLRKKGGWMGSS
jgi:hypothetical protein